MRSIAPTQKERRLFEFITFIIKFKQIFLSFSPSKPIFDSMNTIARFLKQFYFMIWSPSPNNLLFHSEETNPSQKRNTKSKETALSLCIQDRPECIFRRCANHFIGSEISGDKLKTVLNIRLDHECRSQYRQTRVSRGYESR